MYASTVKTSCILIYVNPQATLWDVLSYFYHPSFHEQIHEQRSNYFPKIYNLQSWDLNPVVQLQNLFP